MALRPLYVWTWATWGGTALALLLGFWGNIPHLVVLGVFLVPWTVRLWLSPAFRHEFKQRGRNLWQTCLDYPTKSDAIPWRAAGLFVALPAAILFLANNFVDEGDNVPIMLAATSLVADGDWELSEFLDRPDEYPYVGSMKRTDRGTFSNYPSGPVQFALPVVLVSKVVGGRYQDARVQRRLHKWTAAWLSSACLTLFFLTSLHLVDVGPAWVMTMALATGSAMYTTIGQGLWQHGGIVFRAQLAVLLEFRQTLRPARSTIWLQGLGLGFMMACRLSAALVAGPIVIWVFIRNWRRGLALGALAGLFYLPWAWVYYSNYGQPLGPSTGQTGGFTWDWNRTMAALGGLLVSPGRGFFVYQTWAVLIVGAMLSPYWRRERTPKCARPAGWQAVCASAFVLNLALVSVWGMWWGGWCWGSRLLSDSILLFALLCVQPLEELLQRPWGRWGFATLVVVGFLVHAPAIYLGAHRWNGSPGDIDQQPQRLWSWKASPFLHPIRRILGPSTQSEIALGNGAHE